jgi:dihydropteroate synthase
MAMIDTLMNKTGEIRLPRNRRLPSAATLVMGVLNVTPDSFSDGGRYGNHQNAVAHANEMFIDGADIIDVGGESTRPGAEPVPLEKELERVISVIKEIRHFSDIPISIDTVKSEVARQAIETGADIINDVSALRYDDNMIKIAVKYDCPVIMMHMQGEPRTMQVNPYYEDCVGEIRSFFSERIEYCIKNGLSQSQIVLDPGIGFGKRLEDNLAIINNIAEFKTLGCPILLGTSRKSFIKMITGLNNPAEKRIGGSIASLLACITNGADIVRVHDVAETVEAIKVFNAITGTK